MTFIIEVAVGCYQWEALVSSNHMDPQDPQRVPMCVLVHLVCDCMCLLSMIMFTYCGWLQLFLKFVCTHVISSV